MRGGCAAFTRLDTKTEKRRLLFFVESGFSRIAPP
jgi:hypothetical protein